MIPAFFINLDRHPDRKAFIEKQLTEIGFLAERVPGVDGRDLPPEIASRYSFADYLTDGQVGCSASHLKVWQIVKDRAIPAALVLEDDAIIAPDLASVLAETLSALPNGWDLVRLCRASKRAVKPLARLPHDRWLVRYSRIPIGRAGYLVSQSGATKLLAPRHFDCPGDVEIAHPWRLGLNVFGVDPPPITQERKALPSTIGEERGRLPFWKRAMPNPARVIYNIHQLGLYHWFRCLALNASRHLRAHNGT